MIFFATAALSRVDDGVNEFLGSEGERERERGAKKVASREVLLVALLQAEREADKLDLMNGGGQRGRHLRGRGRRAWRQRKSRERGRLSTDNAHINAAEREKERLREKKVR